MNMLSPVTAASAAPRSLAPSTGILSAANHLLPHLERGEPVDAAIQRSAMEASLAATDAPRAWDWKKASEACEVATVLFLRRYGKALFRKSACPAARSAA